MSKFLTPESVAARPDAHYFSPERLAMLKRVFDRICQEENIVSEVQRNELAVNLLEASKLTRDERALLVVMKYDIAAYNKIEKGQ